MKRILSVLVMLVALFSVASCSLLSGGATKTTTVVEQPNGSKTTTTEIDGFTDTMSYHQSFVAVKKAEADKVESKVQAIKEINTTNLTSDARAIIAFAQSQDISKIKEVSAVPEAPVSGMKVLNTAVGMLPSALNKTLYGYVAHETAGVLKEFAKQKGDEITVGNNNEISGMNRSDVEQEIHANAVGEGNQPNVNQPLASTTPATPTEGTPDPVVITSSERCESQGIGWVFTSDQKCIGPDEED